MRDEKPESGGDIPGLAAALDSAQGRAPFRCPANYQHDEGCHVARRRYPTPYTADPRIPDYKLYRDS